MTQENKNLDIETSLLAINVDEPDAGERLRDLHVSAKIEITRLKELVSSIEACLIDHIIATKKDVEIGIGRKWYVTQEKKTVCINNDAVLYAVLEASGGDVSKLSSGANGVLVASPWKYNAVKSIVGIEKFNELFKTVYSKDAKTGMNLKVLSVSDENFKPRKNVI